MNFTEIFLKLEEIKNLYTKGSRTNANANAEVHSLLKKLDEDCNLLASVSNFDERNYVLQIIQDINKKDKNSENKKRIITYEYHSDHEQYGDFYNHERYQFLMPYCQLAYLSEKNGNPEEHALKLSIIFDNPNDALDYINLSIKNNLTVHDACLFTLPDVLKCSFKILKPKIKTYLKDPNFRQLLGRLSELEKIFTDHTKEKNTKVNREALNNKKQEIKEKNSHFKRLKRKHGQLNSAEEIKYQQLIIELSKLKIDLFHLSKGISISEIDVLMLQAANEYLIFQSEGIYTYLTKQGLTKKDYENFKQLDRSKAGENIPDITLSDEAIGYKNYYLRKLNVTNNETDAAMAACLGKLTNCCQSLSGEVGESCVIHGLTSPHGGFYVLFSKEDKVVGQCWAWRSRTNAIVFDSIEVSKKAEQEIVLQYFRELAKELTNRNHTHKVVCGNASGISSKMIGVVDHCFKEHFIDYYDYCDSKEQRVLFDKNRPFCFYNIDPNIANETHQKIQQAMESKNPIVRSNFLCGLINWMLVREKKEVKLHENLMEIAKKTARHDELQEVIENSKRFLKEELSEMLAELLNKDRLFPSIVLKSGDTALHWAIEGNNPEIVKLFIEKGADINAVDKEGRTLLHWAMDRKNPATVKLLLENGANVNAVDKDGLVHYNGLRVKVLRRVSICYEKRERMLILLLLLKRLTQKNRKDPS